MLRASAAEPRTENRELRTENYFAIARSLSTISDSVGNRPASLLEKICLLSALTTKMPPLPRTSSLSTPSCFLISAARLEARGR
jgi:hypothetical protein